jgi:hypothetical protein
MPVLGTAEKLGGEASGGVLQTLRSHGHGRTLLLREVIITCGDGKKMVVVA